MERLIEEELEQKAANHANITVTPREIDEALGRIAQQNNVTVDRVMEEATKSGLTEQSYRLELKRQLLEAKLMNLRIQGRLRVTDEDVRAAYDHLVSDERKQLGFRAAWIRVSAPHSLAADDLRARRAEVDRIVLAAAPRSRLRAPGKASPEDTATSGNGGGLGQLKPGQLPPVVDAVALSLDVGGISEPIRQGDDFIILKPSGRAPRTNRNFPGFAESRDELSQRGLHETR